MNTTSVQPPVSVYDYSFELNTGETFHLSALKGKKFMLVNTASDCGYTGQYAALQELFAAAEMMILGFPSNDFGQQEKGTDEQIQSFCKVNYGVTFPLAKKSSVVKSPAQNDLYKWLSSSEMNGWNDQEPTWNFCKYIIDEEGKLAGFYGSSVEPAELI